MDLIFMNDYLLMHRIYLKKNRKKTRFYIFKIAHLKLVNFSVTYNKIYERWAK